MYSLVYGSSYQTVRLFLRIAKLFAHFSLCWKIAVVNALFTTYRDSTEDKITCFKREIRICPY